MRGKFHFCVDNCPSGVDSSFGNDGTDSSVDGKGGFNVGRDCDFTSVGLAHGSVIEVESVVDCELGISGDRNDRQNRVTDCEKVQIVLLVVVSFITSGTVFITVTKNSFKDSAVYHDISLYV